MLCATVEDKCQALELETEEKIQKLKTELLNVLSRMTTAQRKLTVREAMGPDGCLRTKHTAPKQVIAPGTVCVCCCASDGDQSLRS